MTARDFTVLYRYSGPTSNAHSALFYRANIIVRKFVYCACGLVSGVVSHGLVCCELSRVVLRLIHCQIAVM